MLWVFRVRKPLSMCSFLMNRIFQSTINRVLTAHTEWLPGVPLRHSVPPVQYTYRGLWGLVVVRLSWLSGRALAAQARGVLELPVTACLSTFLTFHLITSKFISSMRQDALSNIHVSYVLTQFGHLDQIWFLGHGWYCTKRKHCNAEICMLHSFPIHYIRLVVATETHPWLVSVAYVQLP